MYNEETGSSSDEDPDGMSHFVHPGLFILDGNNNLEDDSSMSEDLDAEWRCVKCLKFPTADCAARKSQLQ